MKTILNNQKLYLVLDNIRSRENVGSIFRTADGVGVSKIFLCGITPTPQNSKFETLNSKQYQNSKPEKSRGGPRVSFAGFQIQNSDKISKTALGAEKWVPWEYHKQTWKCLLELKVNPPAGGEKLKVVGLEQAKNSQNIFQYKPKFPLALVVGNEVNGISSKILKYCDKKISIPMYGKKESLNVSVAAGVALYTMKEFC